MQPMVVGCPFPCVQWHNQHWRFPCSFPWVSPKAVAHSQKRNRKFIPGAWTGPLHNSIVGKISESGFATPGVQQLSEMTLPQPDPFLLGTYKMHGLFVMRYYYCHSNSALNFSLHSVKQTHYFCSKPVLTFVTPNEVLFKRSVGELQPQATSCAFLKSQRRSLKNSTLD